MSSETPRNLTLSEINQKKFQAELKDLDKTIKENPTPKSNLYLASLSNKPEPIKHKAKMRDVYPGISDKAQEGCVALPNRELNPNKEKDKPWFDTAWSIGDQVENKLGGTKIFSVFDKIPKNLPGPEEIQTFIKQQVAKNKEEIAALKIPEGSVITLYYPNSKFQEEAYKNGKDKNHPVISTHAGIIKNGKLVHNVKNKAGEGIIYVENLKDFYAQATNDHHCLITGVYDVNSNKNKYKAKPKDTVWKYYTQNKLSHGYPNFDAYTANFIALNKTTKLTAGNYYTLPNAKKSTPKPIAEDKKSEPNKYKAKPNDNVWKYYTQNKTSHGYRNFDEYEKDFIDKNGTTALKVDDFYTLPTKNKLNTPTVIKPKAKKNGFLRVTAVLGDTGGNFFKKYGKGMTYGQYRDWFKANNNKAWETIILGKPYNVKPNKSSNTNVLPGVEAENKLNFSVQTIDLIDDTKNAVRYNSNTNSYELIFKKVPPNVIKISLTGKLGTKYEVASGRNFIRSKGYYNGRVAEEGTIKFSTPANAAFLRNENFAPTWIPEQVTLCFKDRSGTIIGTKEMRLPNNAVNAWEKIPDKNPSQVEKKSASSLAVLAKSGDTGLVFFRKYGKGMTDGQYRDWFKANNNKAWETIILGKPYNVKPNKSAQKQNPVTPSKVAIKPKLPEKKAEKVEHIHSNMTKEESIGNPKTKEVKMYPKLYAEVCEQLDLVNVEYYNENQKLCQGQILIHKDLAADVKEIFDFIRDTVIDGKRFPIKMAKPISVNQFDFDDDASMKANNTSASNFRFVPGKNSLSMHAAFALDINPLKNPYYPNGYGNSPVSPAGAKWDHTKPGTLHPDNKLGAAVVKKMKSLGWQWGVSKKYGGRWNTTDDFQHFSKIPKTAEALDLRAKLRNPRE